MSKRKIGTRTNPRSGKVAIIYRLPDTREYMVAFEGNKAADYFTDCQNDAYGTAERWAQGDGA